MKKTFTTSETPSQNVPFAAVIRNTSRSNTWCRTTLRYLYDSIKLSTEIGNEKKDAEAEVISREISRWRKINLRDYIRCFAYACAFHLQPKYGGTWRPLVQQSHCK